MPILINYSAPCEFALNGKTLRIEGNGAITNITADDLKQLVTKYPYVKGWIDAKYILVDEKYLDSAKADEAAKKAKAEEERLAKAKADAEKAAFDAQVNALIKSGMKKEDAVKKVTAELKGKD